MKLNKHIILLGFLFIFNSVEAQRIEEKILDFHVTPVFSQINSSSDYISPNGINVGLKIGANVNFLLADWVGFTAGLDFTLWSGGNLLYREGGNFLPKSKLSDPQYNQGNMPLPDNTSIRYTLNYIEFPVGLQFNLPPIDDFRIFARIPTITTGFRNRARGTIEAGNLLLESEKIGKDVSFFNFMWGMGLGAEFEYREKEVMAMIFLNSGLSDVTRNKGTQVINSDGGNRVITEDSKAALNQFGIQVAFRIR
ncbi:PorT family protein [Membranihabitans maritimus]|uniref:PorT family protein n=1 Tax=Membranihabitans maritimus TaxID=2904244 RepID=UPI001F2430D4|nr:PorT family protein [Membranihabitans maritimus]